MKKFTKGCLITAGILFLTGFVITMVIGSITGFRLFRDIRSGRFWDSDFLRAGFYWDGDGVIIRDSEDYDIGTEQLIVNGRDVLTTGSEYQVSAEQISNLDLDLGAGEFLLTEKDTDDGMISIYIEGKGRCEYKVKGDTLSLEGFKGNNHYIRISSHNRIEVRVPAGSSFDKIETTIGAGYMEINDITMNEFETEIGAGSLEMRDITTENFNAEIGAGYLEATNITTVNAGFAVNMGQGIYEGEISGNLDAEVGMGDITIDLEGREEDHNYDIECGMGSVSVGSYSTTAFAADRTIQNGVSSNFQINCNMGSVNIQFHE